MKLDATTFWIAAAAVLMACFGLALLPGWFARLAADRKRERVRKALASVPDQWIRK